MTIWMPDIAARAGPRYLAIAEAIAEAVAEGVLAEGARLPPQRNLAYDLGLSFSTVTRAYAEAGRRGLVAGEVGRGTFVGAGGALRAEYVPSWHPGRGAGGLVDFTMNLPTVGEGAARLAETLARLSRSADLAQLLEYRSQGAIDAHAEAGAAWLSRLGMEVPGDEVVVTIGAQHGLLAGLMATTRPGDQVLAEALTYPPLKQIAHHLGIKLRPLEMDAHGLRPEALDAACRATAARVLYCMPTLHSPTAATMPEGRRAEVAAIARRHDLTVIEDDVFGFLPETRPLPLCALAPERTLLVTSVSKSLAPGLRVGYLRAPEGIGEAVRSAVHMSCWMGPPLMAEIARRWISDGTADALNSWQRGEARARQEIAAQLLGRFSYQSDPSGLHLWLHLPEPWRPDAFRAEAERRGVKVMSAEVFAVAETPAPRALRLCLGREASRQRMAAGLETIAGLLEERRVSGLSVL